MKYGLNIFNEKIEAKPGAEGFCPCCRAALVAKCGEVKVHHWAHKGRRKCDPWWENETQWHRAWKNHFPVEWQEIVHKDPQTGEKHIADVKTDEDWCIEFQHSPMKPEERRSRNDFYGKLIWVIDGTRRIRDWPNFEEALRYGQPVDNNRIVHKLNFGEECRLIKEWANTEHLVFFDFNTDEQEAEKPLWFLFPRIETGELFVSSFSRSRFVEMLAGGEFDDFVNKTIKSYHSLLEREFKDIAAQQQRLINSRRNVFAQPRGIRRSRRL